jgi:hypothetical protein
MENYGCTQGKCACPCHVNHEECHHAEHAHGDEMKTNYFLALADEAWQDALKEKIKEYILETQDDRMSKLAKIVAEGNHQRWKHKIEKTQDSKNFMDEIRKFFSQSKK